MDAAGPPSADAQEKSSTARQLGSETTTSWLSARRLAGREATEVGAAEADLAQSPQVSDAVEVQETAVTSLLARFSSQRPGMPVCLITGFLGSGKTTLVNHILANSQGLRAAVFVNEYGSVDVDGALIRSNIDEDRVVSLTNGCVCCEVNEDLAEKLSKLLGARRDSIDVVIIETSGVCDPDPVLSTLQQIEDVDQVHLDTVVCVVDASTIGDAELGASIDAKRQLAHADVLLLNKVDLLEGTEGVQAAESRLQNYCREQGIEPVILRTIRAGVDLAALCGLTSAVGAAPPPAKRRRQELGKRAHGHGLHSRFVTFVYKACRPFDMIKFEEWAQNPPAGVLRAKGLLWMQGIPRYVCFHLAGRRTNPFETLPSCESPVASEIVFVGRDDVDASPVDQDGIVRALDSCLC